MAGRSESGKHVCFRSPRGLDVLDTRRSEADERAHRPASATLARELQHESECQPTAVTAARQRRRSEPPGCSTARQRHRRRSDPRCARARHSASRHASRHRWSHRRSAAHATARQQRLEAARHRHRQTRPLAAAPPLFDRHTGDANPARVSNNTAVSNSRATADPEERTPPRTAGPRAYGGLRRPQVRHDPRQVDRLREPASGRACGVG
jgi:hypothetical protein